MDRQTLICFLLDAASVKLKGKLANWLHLETAINMEVGVMEMLGGRKGIQPVKN